MSATEQTIEYFYSAHSVFAYLGSCRLVEIARDRSARIVHFPINLREAMDAAGSSRFAERSQEHIRYFFGTEIERWSQARGLPWLGRTPTYHHEDYTIANRLLVAAQEAGIDVDELSHQFLRAHWVDDVDLSDETTLKRIADAANLDGQDLLNRALEVEANKICKRNTQIAIERSVFGSPTFFVDGEMFYGQDRLDFVEQALLSHDR